MRNRILFATLLTLVAATSKAQTGNDKMSDTQKEQAAKADAFIVNSRKKVVDSFTTAAKDSTAIKQTKKKSCLRRNKKSS